MDLKLKGINWVGNIYQKFEAICQEVDDVVSQDAVKYVENQVQNVGESVKKFYSDVQDLLPPFTIPARNEAQTVPSNRDTAEIESSFKSITSNKQNKKGIEENPVNTVMKPSCESNSFDAASNQKGHVHSGDQLVTQASSHTSSISSELEEFNLALEKVDDDNTKGNAGAHIKEKSLVNVDEDAMEFTPLVLDLVSPCDKEPLESSPFSKSFDGFDKNFCGAGTKENSGISVEENSHVIDEENALKKSTPLVMELISPGKKGPCEGAFFNESFNDVDEKVCRDLAGIKEDTEVGVDYSDVSVEESSHVIFEENGMKRSNSGMLELISSYEKELSASSYLTGAIDVVDENACSVSSSAATSVQNAELLGTATDNIADETEFIFDGLDTLASSKMDFSFMSSEISNTQMEPLTLNSSLCWDSQHANSSENFSFEAVSCKTNLVDVVGYTSDSSRLLVLCAPTSVVPGEVKDFEVAHVSSCSSQSVESGDDSICDSIISGMENVELSNKSKFEESCVFVDDNELHAVSCRAQKLRSYKKKIRDAFASKKRLAKEFEQLAIWHGDTAMEFSQDRSHSLFPITPITSLESKNLQGQHACDSEWELL